MPCCCRHQRGGSVFVWPAILFALLLLPACASACEPLVPIIWAFLAPTAVGGFIFASGVGFIVIVAIKCAVFVWKSDFKSWSAVFYMLIANIVSTAVGIVVAVIAGNPMFIFVIVGFLVLLVAYTPPAKRLHRLGKLSRIPEAGISLLLSLMTVATVFLFLFAAGVMEEGSLRLYWLLKIGASILAIGLSLFISVAYEETVISALYRRFREETRSFMTPVLWANIIALFLIMLIGAAVALPKRLASPDFLYSSTPTQQETSTVLP